MNVLETFVNRKKNNRENNYTWKTNFFCECSKNFPGVVSFFSEFLTIKKLHLRFSMLGI